MIGAAIRRVEDARLLTGRGQFVDDLAFPEMLYCALVRSPHPHARIANIDARDALVPGVAAVLTGKEMAADGVAPMSAGWALPGMVELPRWALARDTVRHVGELPPVADARSFRWTRGDAAAVEADIEMPATPHRVWRAIMGK